MMHIQNMTRKILTVIGIFFLVLLIIFFISVPIVNDNSAKKEKKFLEELPLPADTELVESLSQAGKFTGNGNGMQYFAAILIKSELSLEELDFFYEPYRQNEWDCMIKKQEGQEIDVIEHGTITFKESLSSDENYFFVYSWGSGISPFDQLDLRGH